MKLFPIVDRALAPFGLALAAFVAPLPLAQALPQGLQLEATGRFQEMSDRSTLVQARVLNAAGVAVHQLQALLVGPAAAGNLYGQMDEIPQLGEPDPEGLWDLHYDLVGSYTRGIDGRVHVVAQVLLDLSPTGIDVVILAGEMQGVLIPAPSEIKNASVAGYCPAPLPGDTKQVDSDLSVIGAAGPDAVRTQQATKVDRKQETKQESKREHKQAAQLDAAAIEDAAVPQLARGKFKARITMAE